MEEKGGVVGWGVGIMRTTKGGPHGHVHRARNFISENGRPCVFHAARKRHDAIPIDNHAIYTRATQQHGMAEEKRASVNRWMENGNNGVAIASGENGCRTWLETPTRFCSHSHS